MIGLTCVLNVNPIEHAFLNWISNYPLSAHPIDDKRFYIFVKTIFQYYKTEGQKWINEEYFFNKCKHKNLPDDFIKIKYKLLLELIHYEQSNSKPIVKRNKIFDSDKNEEFIARVVVNDIIEDIKINEEIYNKGFLSKKDIKSIINTSMEE